MQAELTDKVNEYEGLRSAAKTALIVVLVCFAMPFFRIAAGDVTASFSIWQFGGSAFRYSDIGALLPLTYASRLIAVRVMAWLMMVLTSLSLILLFSKNRASKTKDNTMLPLILSVIVLFLSFGLYFYIGCVLKSGAGDVSVAVTFDNGGLAVVAALAVASLCLLVKRVRNRTALAAVLIFIAIPLTIIFGSMLLDNRKYYFISLLVIFETMLPFFLIFENRKPEARELVIISVMAGIAVVGRAVFFMLPNFKPVTAIVIISGACLGPEAGFLTGAMTAFVSNFFFGQGPWTPWQMFAFGIIGFLTGLLVRWGILRRERKRLCLYGVIVTFCIYGFLLNTYTVFTMDFVSSWAEVLAVYASGFPVDCVHASATAVFMLVLAKPMIEKIERVRKKYGMMEHGGENDEENRVPLKLGRKKLKDGEQSHE